MAVALTAYDGTSVHFDTINAMNSTAVPWNRGTYNADSAAGSTFLGHLNYLNQAGRTNSSVPGQAYPQDLTYTQIANIVQTFKNVGSSLGLNVKVLDGVDAGHEFAFKPWQYGKHPEMLFGGDVIGFYNPLNADPTAYASYPNGIPQGTADGHFHR